MATIRKFMFDVSFDEPHPLEDAPVAVASESESEVESPPPPPPTFTEDEVDQLKAEAFEAGRAEGRMEAQAADERMAVLALEAAAAKMGELARLEAAAADRNAREAIAVAVSVVRKMLPELARREGLGEIEALVAECIGRLTGEARIMLRVAESLRERVAERIEPIAARVGFEGRLLTAGEASLAPGDCRLEWADGGAERDSARLMGEIDGILERYLGAASPG